MHTVGRAWQAGPAAACCGGAAATRHVYSTQPVHHTNPPSMPTSAPHCLAPPSSLPPSPSVSLHTVQLGLVLFVCMAEALYGHMASLPLGELEEPLFDKVRCADGGGRGWQGVGW